MPEIFFSSSTILITSVLLAYLAGYGFLFFTNSLPARKYLKVFASLCIGITIGVLLTSVVATGFKTINLGFVLLFLWYSYGQKKSPPELNGNVVAKNTFALREHVLVAAELLVVAFLIAGYRYLTIYAIHEIPAVTPDNAFYSRLSFFILQSGKETIYPDFIFPGSLKVLPYHYYELWLNAGLATLFKANFLQVFLLVTSSLGIVILWVGYCALFEHRGNVNIVIKGLCFLLLFICGYYPQVFSDLELFPFAAGLQLNAFRATKLFPLYLLLIASGLSFLYKKDTLGFILLLALPLVSFSTAPGVLGSLFIFSAWLFIVRRSKQLALNLFLQTLSISVFILLFYWIFPATSATDHTPFKLSALWSAFSLSVFFKQIYQGLGFLVVLYLPVALLFVFSLSVLRFQWSKGLNKGSGLGLLLILTSLIVSAFLGEKLDAIQVFWNVAVVLLNMLLVAGLVLLYHRLTSRAGLILALPFFIYAMLCFLATTQRMGMKKTYSDAYLLSTSKALENLNPVGAFIKDRTDYNSIYEKSSAVYPKGEYLGVFKKEFQAIALSVFEIPVTAGSANYETAKFLIRNTSFYRFVQDQKQKNAFISIAQSQVDFIKALKIEYLLVSKNARLPEKIADLVSTVIADPLSGEKCYILNPSK